MTLLRIIEEAYDDANLYGLEWAFQELRDLLGFTKFKVEEAQRDG